MAFKMEPLQDLSIPSSSALFSWLNVVCRSIQPASLLRPLSAQEESFANKESRDCFEEPSPLPFEKYSPMLGNLPPISISKNDWPELKKED